MDYNLDISKLKGIGAKIKAMLAKLNIYTVADMLSHYPIRYEKFEEPGNIKEYTGEEKVTLSARLFAPIEQKKVQRLTLSIATLTDGERFIKAVWYNQTYIDKVLRRGEDYVFVGKLSKKSGRYSLEQPAIYTKEEYKSLSGKLVPIYPLTKGISNNFFNKHISLILSEIEPKKDYLPKVFIEKLELISYEESLSLIHRPNSYEDIDRARKRLVFDDFFTFALALRRLKEEDTKEKTKYLLESNACMEEFTKALPYELTATQLKSMEEIEKDCMSGYAMNRLIQGDVGSGKTVVSIYAMYLAYKNSYQSAIMVPTEVLAKQHFKNITSIFEKFDDPPKVGILTGSMTKKEHLEIYKQVKDKTIDIIVGTHALIQDALEFDDIALVITDEQHRFGVRQRQKLLEKSKMLHSMIMSATPIPRTLALILYGDLDISYIKEKPKGRLDIKNCVIFDKDREKAYKHIQKELEKGHQAYVICPLVEESENIEAENVFDYREKLAKYLPKNYNIKVMHGKLPESEKAAIMSEFVSGDIDILVSTTVIEVGVDVANATVIMIEDAQRFGLASLHQLRGRVGRNMYQSYCIFVCTSDSKAAKERLDIIGNSNDGFFISESDLKLRGPGDLFGLLQSGELSFELADMHNDGEIFKLAIYALKLFDDPKEISDEEKACVYEHISQKQNKNMGRLTL